MACRPSGIQNKAKTKKTPGNSPTRQLAGDVTDGRFHLLTTPGENLAEKFAYICQNRVRGGLVRNEHAWSYALIPDRQQVGAFDPFDQIPGSGD